MGSFFCWNFRWWQKHGDTYWWICWFRIMLETFHHSVLLALLSSNGSCWNRSRFILLWRHYLWLTTYESQVIIIRLTENRSPHRYQRPSQDSKTHKCIFWKGWMYFEWYGLHEVITVFWLVQSLIMIQSINNGRYLDNRKSSRIINAEWRCRHGAQRCLCAHS